MSIIKPFRGILYDTNKIRRVKDLLAPPYDVISNHMQDLLYASSPYNVVRLILGKKYSNDNALYNRYTRAKDFLAKWLNDGVLVRDAKPAIYIYGQDYKDQNLKKRRIGFIALMKLEELSKKSVLPHEDTFKEPKEDRFKLISKLRANLSPIFSLYKDEGRLVRKAISSYSRETEPIIDVYSKGVRHRLWRLTERDAVRKIRRAMRGKTIFIADGHHRYEAAFKFRDEMRKRCKTSRGLYDYVMMYFSDMDPKGMTILAAHRAIKDVGNIEEGGLVEKLKRCFYIERLNSKKRLFAWLKKSKNLSRQFGLYVNKKAYVIKLKSLKYIDDSRRSAESRTRRSLDVSILHDLILKRVLRISAREGNVAYIQDPQEAVREVDRGRCKLAFLLNPTKISQVESIARAKERMPHKSTYFYPKPLSGLVINVIGEC